MKLSMVARECDVAGVVLATGIIKEQHRATTIHRAKLTDVSDD